MTLSKAVVVSFLGGILGCALMPQAALATVPPGLMVSYRYTGQPLTFEIDEPGSGPFFQLSAPITEEYLFSDYLSQGLHLSLPYSQGSTPGGDTYRRDAALDIDASGAVVGWLLSSTVNGSWGEAGSVSVSGFGFQTVDYAHVTSAAGTVHRFNWESPGTWTVSLVVPEPETYALALTGLMVVGLSLRNRQGR